MEVKFETEQHVVVEERWHNRRRKKDWILFETIENLVR